MSAVGIIANPASGRDIRRLVAHASVFGNSEKVNILRRLLLAMDSVGVDEALIMPDSFGIGLRALDGLKLFRLRARIAEMPVTGTERDSVEAADGFRRYGVGCIVVLGGDGTNRVVAKSCGEVPLVSISTGTNNIFPAMIEGTVAGMAAGLVATGQVPVEKVGYRSKRLQLLLDGEEADTALIDVVASTDLWIGSRAIWDPSRIKEVVLARSEFGAIGISSLGCCFQYLGREDSRGIYLSLGEGGTRLLAPLAPGLVMPVSIKEHRVLSMGDTVQLRPDASTIALDGEREIEIYGKREIAVRLMPDGPVAVDVARCMEVAARSGVFHRLSAPPA